MGFKFDPDGSSRIECWLGPLEGVVMEAIWGWPNHTLGIPAEKVLKYLVDTDDQGRAYTTFSTSLYRLVEKGLVERVGRVRSRGRKMIIRSKVSEAEFYSQRIQEILSKLLEEEPSKTQSIYNSLVERRGRRDHDRPVVSATLHDLESDS